MFSFFKKITKFFFGKNLGAIPGVRPLYKFLFGKLKPKGIVLTKVDTGKMFVDSSDTGLAPYLLMHGVFGEYETELVKEIVKPGAVVIDVGANIGYFTLLFSRLAGEGGKVYAFEPDPKNHELLLKNLDVNKVGNTTAVKKALSNKTGKTKLFLDQLNLGDMSMAAGNIDNPAGFLEVETITLDEYLAGEQEKRVDFIKIDVQGAEALVIEGAEKTIKTAKPKILLEFWPWGLRNLGSDPEALLRRIEGYGYTIKVLDVQNFVLKTQSVSEIMRLQKNRKDGRGFANLLCEF